MSKFIDTTDYKACEEANKEEQNCSSDERTILELCERDKLEKVFDYLSKVKNINCEFCFLDFIRIKEFLK